MFGSRRPPPPADGVPRRTLPDIRNANLTKREEGIKRIIVNVMKRTGEFPWDAHSAVFREVGMKLGLVQAPAPDASLQAPPDARETLVATAQAPAEAAPVVPEPPVHEHALIDPAIFPNRQGVSSAPTPMEIDAGAEIDEGPALEPVVMPAASGEAPIPGLDSTLPAQQEIERPVEAPVARNDGGSGPTGDLTATAAAVTTGEVVPVNPSGLINAEPAAPRAPLTLQNLPIDGASSIQEQVADPQIGPPQIGPPPAQPTPTITDNSLSSSIPSIRAALDSSAELRMRSRSVKLMKSAIASARSAVSTSEGGSCTPDRALLIVKAFRAAKTGVEQLNAFLRYYYYTRYPIVGATHVSDVDEQKQPVGLIVNRIVGPTEDIQPGSRAWSVLCFPRTYASGDNFLTTGGFAISPVQQLSQDERATIMRSFSNEVVLTLGFDYTAVTPTALALRRGRIRPAPDVAAILHQISDLILSQVDQTHDFDPSSLATVGFVASFLSAVSNDNRSLLHAFAIAAENSLGYDPSRESLAWALARAGVENSGTIVAYLQAAGELAGGNYGAVSVGRAARHLQSLGERAITGAFAQYGTFATQTSLVSAVYMFVEQIALSLPLFTDEEAFASHMIGFFRPGLQVYDISEPSWLDFWRRTPLDRHLSDPTKLLWYTYSGDDAFRAGNYHPFAVATSRQVAGAGVSLANCFVSAPGWETASERRGTILRVQGALGGGLSLSSVRAGAGNYLGDLFTFIEQKNNLRPPNDTRRPASLGVPLDALNSTIRATSQQSASSTVAPGDTRLGAIGGGDPNRLGALAEIARTVNTTSISTDRTSIEGIEEALAREQKMTLELANRDARTRPDEPELSALGVAEVDAPSHPLNSIGGNRLFVGDDERNPLVAYRVAIAENNDRAEHLIYERPSLARAPQNVNDGFFGKSFIADCNASTTNYLTATHPPMLRFALTDVQERTVPFKPISNAANRVRALAPPPPAHSYEIDARPFSLASIAHFGVSSSPANDLVRLAMSAEGITGSLAAAHDQ